MSKKPKTILFKNNKDRVILEPTYKNKKSPVFLHQIKKYYGWRTINFTFTTFVNNSLEAALNYFELKP